MIDSLISVDVTIPQVNAQTQVISSVLIFTVVEVSEDRCTRCMRCAQCAQCTTAATSPTLIHSDPSTLPRNAASVASSPRQPPALRGIEVSRLVASQFTQFTWKSSKCVEVVHANIFEHRTSNHAEVQRIKRFERFEN